VLNVSNELNIIDDEILNLIDPQDVEEDVLQSALYLDPTFELLAAVTNKCEILRAESSSAIHPITNGSGVSKNSSISSQCKLPKFELPSFNGDPLLWQGFWDQLSMIMKV